MYNSFIMRELKKGSLQMLILAVVADGPRHGYAIAREIERRSQNLLQNGEGALYPALRALERDGWLLSRWETQPAGPARRVYELTDEGGAKLAAQIKEWREFAQAVDSVLGGFPDASPA